MDFHSPVHSQIVDALAKLDDRALRSLADLISTWSVFDSEATPLPALASGTSTPAREYSDPGSNDFPLVNYRPEDLGENLFASDDDEAPGPSTPLPSPPSGPLQNLPSPPGAPSLDFPDPSDPSDEYRPRVRPVRYVPFHHDNESPALQPNDTAPSFEDSINTLHIQANIPYRLKCWQGILGRHMSPVLPQPGDCLDALALLVAGDKQDAPILFSEHHGYKLPHRVAWGTCAIVLTISGGPNATVTTTFRDIGNVVRIIMENCNDVEKDDRGGM